MNRSLYLAAVVALAFTAAPAPAAVITWSAATGITGDTNVSTNGSLVGAFNLGSTVAGLTTTTVNGVTFTAQDVTGSTNNYSFGNFTLDFGGSGAGSLTSSSGNPHSPDCRRRTRLW